MSKPVRGQVFVFTVALVSRADANVFQSNPTLAAGDVKVIKDDGAPANIATLPTAISAGAALKVQLSATETDADYLTVLFQDAAGDQWCDLAVTLFPDGSFVTSAVDDVSATTTVFDTDLTNAIDDLFNNAFLVFTDGNLRGVSRKISGYDGTTNVGRITLATALPSAPADNDPFMIVGRSE